MKPVSTLALIPAKGASTRLPRKNLLRLGGATLTARAVACAFAAGGFADVVVTTEDAEIAAEARRAGASVPFLRPSRLAVDPAGVVDVALHALDELEARGKTFDTVAILLPTSPFRTPDDVRAAFARYVEKDVDFLMSVCSYSHTPLAALACDADGLLTPFLPEWLGRLGAASTSAIPHLVRSNGAIQICNVARLRAERDYYAYPLAAYEMPWERSVDIDTEADVRLAEFLMERATP
ncbi:MAG TPA: acylneuraminate cytidylyltransferase family protein [Candidatus Baltobacteraceae bacterium]|jgi:CMP-N-acetylneuraminic acid synthetase|nr:acylneuraminate cytidylyltransferase family protein [Candidatus Baltobacteraceae bacterium]